MISESDLDPSIEGILRKRSGRLQRWTSRYFILSKSKNGSAKLAYKQKKDSPIKNCFDLQAGCACTEVVEEVTTSRKKLYSFWIVWPADKNQKEIPPPSDSKSIAGDESDEEETSKKPEAKGLKDIVQREKLSQIQQKTHIEEDVKNYKAQDHNVRLGVKVAAVAAGGAVVGALTAGIGLIPYMAVVGVIAAGGGAVFFQSHSRPLGSRLIVAAESYDEASKWKTAIEEEIAKLERSRKPMLPSCADANVISSIIDNGRDSAWKCIALKERTRFLEQIDPAPNTVCRKAQVTVNCIPVTVFIAVMEGQHWPCGGRIKVEKVIDDHADLISVTITTTFKPKPEKTWDSFMYTKTTTSCRTLNLTRFWQLDDDGIYLVTLNTVKSLPESSSSSSEPALNIVITIAPRKDHAEFFDDLPSALVTCVAQVSTVGNWKAGEVDQFMNDLLYQQLLDLKQSLFFGRYGFNNDMTSMTTSSPITTSMGNDSKISGFPTLDLRRTASSPDGNEAINKQNFFDKPSSSSNQRSDSRSRPISYGITTQQPGLDDASLSSYNHNAAVNAMREEYSTSPPNKTSPINGMAPPAPLARGKSMGIFRRKEPSSASKAANVPPTSYRNDKSNVSNDMMLSSSSKSNSYRIAKRYSRFSAHRKSLNANPEAAFLRQQIAAKEYELDRIEKLIAKKMPTQENITVASQQRLIMELRDLKAKFQVMTGQAYETTARKRGPLSRLRVFRGQASSAIPPPPTSSPMSSARSQDMTALASSSSSTTACYPSGASRSIILPSHWRKSIRMVNEDTTTRRRKSREHFAMMLMTVGMFTVSMVASMMLRHYISLFIVSL